MNNIKIISDFIKYLSAGIILRIVNIIILPILFIFISSNQYGDSILTLSYISFLSPFITLNFGSGALRLIYSFDTTQDKLNKLKEIIFLVSCTVICLSIVLGIISAFTIPIVLTYSPIWLILAASTKAIVNFLLNILVALERSKAFSIFLIIQGIGAIFVALIYAIFSPNHFSIHPIVSSLTVDGIILIILFKNLNLFNTNKLPTRKDIKYIIRYSLLHLPNMLSGVIVENIMKLVLGHRVNSNSVGIYHIYIQLQSISGQLMGSVRNSLVPEYYRIAKNENKLSNWISLYFSMNVAIHILTLIVSPIIFYFFFKEYNYVFELSTLVLTSGFLIEIMNYFKINYEIELKPHLGSIVSIFQGILLAVLVSTFINPSMQDDLPFKIHFISTLITYIIVILFDSRIKYRLLNKRIPLNFHFIIVLFSMLTLLMNSFRHMPIYAGFLMIISIWTYKTIKKSLKWNNG